MRGGIITNLRTTFGELLKAHLRSKRIKQTELAAYLEVSNAAISQVIHGQMILGMDQLEKAAKFIGLSTEDKFVMSDLLVKIRTGSTVLRSPLNELFQAWRKKRDITFNKLSNLSGIPASRLEVIEENPDAHLTLSEAEKLAPILGGSAEELWRLANLTWQQTVSLYNAPIQDDSVSYENLEPVGAPFIAAESQAAYYPFMVPVMPVNKLAKFPTEDSTKEVVWSSFVKRYRDNMVKSEADGVVIVHGKSGDVAGMLPGYFKMVLAENAPNPKEKQEKLFIGLEKLSRRLTLFTNKAPKNVFWALEVKYMVMSSEKPE